VVHVTSRKAGVISPILANVYVHYVFDLWVHRWRLTKALGNMIVIRARIRGRSPVR
jgi:hypothetical protein